MISKVVQHIEQTATVGSYGASGLSVFLGLTVDEWGVVGVIGGLILALATFLFNVWFKMKYHRGNNHELEQ